MRTKENLFKAFKRDENGNVTVSEFYKYLNDQGISINDPRLDQVNTKLEVLSNNSINKTLLDSLCRENNFLKKVIRKESIIPDFKSLSKLIEKIFQESAADTSGSVANYIPQLGKVSPENFSVSICTVDGQIFSTGNTEHPFSVQSTCKPILYSIALEEHGLEKLHRHVGKEPSGVSFNALTLNPDGLPHNPMINAGAIMSTSMIRAEEKMANRFEYIQSVWNQLIGNNKVSFNNSMYLSERETADRNWALGYFMKEKNAFPEGTRLDNSLDLFFQNCSVEINIRDYSKVAATYANSGINPFTNEKVFETETVKNTLSVMHSCGMYDYSGEFAFTIGLPAKSGVSGAIWIVVPNVMGIAIYSPALDKFGNSVRGINFAKSFSQQFNFHPLDSHNYQNKKTDPRQNRYEKETNQVMALIFAAANGDLDEMRRLHALGADLSQGDYDGRTPLHLACAENHSETVAYLIKEGADTTARDRWGNVPETDKVTALQLRKAI